MKLPVYLYGHPVLRAISEPLDESYPDLRKLIDDMFACMYESDSPRTSPALSISASRGSTRISSPRPRKSPDTSPA